MALGFYPPDKSEYREKVEYCPKCGAARGLFRIRYQQSGEQDWSEAERMRMEYYERTSPFAQEYAERKSKKDEDDYAG